MSEYVKTSSANGSTWKLISYSERKTSNGKGENAHPDPPVAENMDEEPAGAGSGGEEDPAVGAGIAATG